MPLDWYLFVAKNSRRLYLPFDNVGRRTISGKGPQNIIVTKTSESLSVKVTM